MNKLTIHQEEVFNEIIKIVNKSLSILKSDNVFDYMISLQGVAGSGKTFMISELVKYFNNKSSLDYDCIITAPTHKAVGVLANSFKKQSINATTKTIHSFLGIKPIVDYNTGVESFMVDKSVKYKDSTSILIIDESSMVSNELFEFIIEAIEAQRVNVVIFVGDSYQLLPINGGENPVYKLKNQFKLTEIVRQAKDSYIITLATAIRKMIQSQKFIPLSEFVAQHSDNITIFNNKDAFLEDFYKNKNWFEEDKIIASYTNKNVNSFNEIIRNVYWLQKNVVSPEFLLKGDRLKFVESYNVGNTTLYNNSQEITLDYAKKVYHQSLKLYYWECKEVDNSEQQIFRVIDKDEIYKYNEFLEKIAKQAKKEKNFFERKKLWKGFYEIKSMFANVQYIYASTIHKLQGSTYDESYVDLFSLEHSTISDDLKYRLFYVAITRARKDIKIFISSNKNQDINVIQKHKEIDSFLEEILVF